VWASHGVQHPLGHDFSGAQDLIPQTLDEQTVLSYLRNVPVSMLKDVLLTGTPNEVIDQAAEWRDHGVRYLVASNVSHLQPKLGKSIASVAPFFKILRGLKKL
jgi:phthiodiolone/phenolphthiodiolone dimycocerosates ketoreductase